LTAILGYLITIGVDATFYDDFTTLSGKKINHKTDEQIISWSFYENSNGFDALAGPIFFSIRRVLSFAIQKDEIPEIRFFMRLFCVWHF
jgi:hypothetical protein